MRSLVKFEYTFVIWHETGGRHGGRGFVLSANKNEAARRVKVQLSKDLDTPPHDINVVSLKKVTP